MGVGVRKRKEGRDKREGDPEGAVRRREATAAGPGGASPCYRSPAVAVWSHVSCAVAQRNESSSAEQRRDGMTQAWPTSAMEQASGVYEVARPLGDHG